MKDNPPVNILIGGAVKQFEEHPEKVRMLYRDVLAERLGVSPKERLTLTVVEDDKIVCVSCLLDGGDLTESQLKIFQQFLGESGALAILGAYPEKPVTS